MRIIKLSHQTLQLHFEQSNICFAVKIGDDNVIMIPRDLRIEDGFIFLTSSLSDFHQ